MKIKNILKKTYSQILREFNFFSFLIGIALANLTWALQPNWSQGKYLAINGMFNEVFFFIFIVLTLPILGIFIYKLNKNRKKYAKL